MNRQKSSRLTQAVQVESADVSNTFTCYICDTEVPKTHMRDHFEGAKHKTCLQVAEVALERARRQLHLEVEPLYEHDIGTYYCDPCSVVLLKSDKTDHEISETHSENMQYFNVIKSFSAFYMNRENANNLKESDVIYTSPLQSPQTESKESSREAELQAVLNHLKEATTHIESTGGALAKDPDLNKALTGLKFTVDRTLHELQETVARKESVFDKAINNLKESAEKTLHDLKESAEIKHQTDVQRSKLSEEAELEISKFKNKLSRINLIRKNKKKTNLPQPIVHPPLKMFATCSNNLIYANLKNDVIGAPMNPATFLPLWSSRGMFNDEYLQVQVTQLPLEKSTDDILSMNTYKCHICDTKVPKQYMRAHNEGERHKLCLKIADIALERARNQMKLDVKESTVSFEVTESYFCVHCSVITKDKSIHENTEAHRMSVDYIDLLEHFFIVYEDKDAACATLYDHFDNVETFKKAFGRQTGLEETDNDKIDLKISNESDISKETELETNIECNVQESAQNQSGLESDGSDNTLTEVNESNATKSDNDEQQYEIQAKSAASNNNDQRNEQNGPQKQSDISKLSYRDINWDAQICKMDEIDRLNDLSKAKKKENSQKANSELAIYLKRVTEKHKDTPTHAVEALTDKLILITAVNGDKIKVPVNSFHSIHAQKDKSYCKICENPDIGYRHIDGEEHMEKVMVPIEDQNGIRMVDDVWSHCVLCNDLTKNINFHLQSLLHRNKLKQALVATATDINQNIIQKPSENSQLIQEHSLVVSHNRSEITCNICNITIPNHLISIKDHINTFDHITTYNETIEQNKLCEIDEGEFYCVPCDMIVSKCYALGHCNGKKHNKHLSEMLSKEDVTVECTQVILPSISQQVTRCKPKSAKTDSDLICFVCNTVLYNLNNHMNSLEHKKNYFSYLEANKLNEIDEDTFFCIPCNTVILIDYLMGHCNAKKHKMHVKNFIANSASMETQNGQSGQLLAENSHISRSITESKQKQANVAIQPNTVSLNGVFDTAIPLKHIYQFTEMSNSGSLLCTICDEEVPYRKYEVQNHVTQIEHVVAFNLLMLWNKIKRKNNKYFCDYCKVDITYFNELSHVNTAGHVDAMSKEAKWTVYEYDKVLLTLEFAMSHKIGDRVRPHSLIVSKPKE